MSKTEEKFDAIAMVRSARDRIAAELEGMTLEERVKWLASRQIDDPFLKRLRDSDCQQADAADRPPAGRRSARRQAAERIIPKRSIAPIACIMLAVACRTAPLPEPYLIEIPRGMTQQQLEVAIVAGTLNSHPPADYDPMAELPEEEFSALLWKRFVGTARSRSWFPESREGDTIYASVKTRGLYLRAAIERGPEQLRISIVGSRNLSEGGGRIHKRAVAWIRNLEAHIRREVGRMSLIVGRAAQQAVAPDTKGRAPIGARYTDSFRAPSAAPGQALSWCSLVAL